MSSRSNYRVKVDLTKYHQDARRFSWIYIDCTSVWFISHVKQHIADIFGTEEPFHLLLNGKEYLPPNEDVRVLKENELIAIEPGTGISNADDLTIATPRSFNTSTNGTVAVQPMDTKNMEHHIDKSKMLIDQEKNLNKTALDDSIADVSAIDVTAYHSMWEGTEAENNSRNTTPNNEDSTANSSIIDFNGAAIRKRKRIRRKRSKHTVDESLTVTSDDKPQRVHYNKKTLHLVPTGKHIHFDNADDRIHDTLDNGANESAAGNEKRETTSPSPPVVNAKPRNDVLSTLLALRQTSTPLMFVNKKLKHTSENKLEDGTIDGEYKSLEKCSSPNDGRISQDVESNGNKNVNPITEIPRDYSNIDPEKYPSLENGTEINDIIAFKILKIGNEYTPEVSDYIIAKTISWCPKKLLFTFKILSGQMHIQTPLGKFSLPPDESEHEICDTATFHFAQLIDPRLIYRQ